jgi:predicted Rdx family selenoprotein
MLMSQEFCRLCQAPIVIPGLDAVYCSRCGWVISPEWLVKMQQELSAFKRRKSRKEIA